MTAAIERAQPALPALDLGPAVNAAAALGPQGVEVLERLYRLREADRAATARAAFCDAMAELHASIGSIPKNRTAAFSTKSGGRVSYRYADLHAIASVLRWHTGRLGLSWRWQPECDGQSVVMSCVVSHRLGHSETSTWRAPVEGGNSLTTAAQKGKIAVTFAERVTLIAAFGLTDCEDDLDGAAVATAEPAATAGAPAESDEDVVSDWCRRMVDCETDADLLALGQQLRAATMAEADREALREAFVARRADLRARDAAERREQAAHSYDPDTAGREPGQEGGGRVP